MIPRGLTDISWPGLFIGVSAPTYLLLGLSRPKPRRCAKPSRKPTLLSLRGRLMAEEVPGSSEAKSRAGAVYPYWGSHPKPWRCAKLSRGPALLSLRDRLMAEEVPGSSVAMRGQGRSYVAG